MLCFFFYSQMLPGSLKREDTRKQVKLFCSLLHSMSKYEAVAVYQAEFLRLGAQWGAPSLSLAVCKRFIKPCLWASLPGLANLLRAQGVTGCPGGRNGPRETGSEVLQCPKQACVEQTTGLDSMALSWALVPNAYCPQHSTMLQQPFNFRPGVHFLCPRGCLALLRVSTWPCFEKRCSSTYSEFLSQSPMRA